MPRLDSLRYLWSAELLAWALQGQLGSWASLSMSAVGLGVWLEPWFSKCGTQATSSCITWTLWFLSPTPNLLNQELRGGARQSVF